MFQKQGKYQRQTVWLYVNDCYNLMVILFESFKVDIIMNTQVEQFERPSAFLRLSKGN
jgi:hypothetical protein